MVERLKRDPLGWYGANGLTMPLCLENLAQGDVPPDERLAQHRSRIATLEHRYRWAPLLFDDVSVASLVFDVVCGTLLIVLTVPRGAVNGRYADWNRYIV